MSLLEGLKVLSQVWAKLPENQTTSYQDRWWVIAKGRTRSTSRNLLRRIALSTKHSLKHYRRRLKKAAISPSSRRVVDRPIMHQPRRRGRNLSRCKWCAESTAEPLGARSEWRGAREFIPGLIPSLRSLTKQRLMFAAFQGIFSAEEHRQDRPRQCCSSRDLSSLAYRWGTESWSQRKSFSLCVSPGLSRHVLNFFRDQGHGAAHSILLTN